MVALSQDPDKAGVSRYEIEESGWYRRMSGFFGFFWAGIDFKIGLDIVWDDEW